MGEVNFLTTHIICDYFSTSQESDWNRTATCPKILSLDWLVRTFQFKRSINEELYFTKGVADHRIDVEIPEYNDMPGKNFKFEYLPVEEIQDAQNYSVIESMGDISMNKLSRSVSMQPRGGQSQQFTNDITQNKEEDFQNGKAHSQIPSRSKRKIDSQEILNFNGEETKNFGDIDKSTNLYASPESQIKSAPKIKRRLTLNRDSLHPFNRAGNPLGRKSSISFANFNKPQSDAGFKQKKPRKSESAIQQVSKIFKSRVFYLPNKMKGKSSIIRKIISNSGNIVKDLMRYPYKDTVYIVLKDGDVRSQQEINESYKKRKSEYKMRLVSPRFLDHCLEKKMFVRNPKKDKILYLLPFNCKIPLPGSKKIQVQVKFRDMVQKEIYEKCCELLGFQLVEDRAEANLVLMDNARYKGLTMERKAKFSGLYKKAKFVLECINHGQIYSKDVRKMLGLGVLELKKATPGVSKENKSPQPLQLKGVLKSRTKAKSQTLPLKKPVKNKEIESDLTRQIEIAAKRARDARVNFSFSKQHVLAPEGLISKEQVDTNGDGSGESLTEANADVNEVKVKSRLVKKIRGVK